jgi:membrane protease YdiL (CAAX protease family)
MVDNASFLRLDDQPPVIRLLLSFLFTVVTGTILFWLLIYCGSLIFSTEISSMIKIPEPGAVEKQITILRYVQASQQVGLFLIPSLFLAMLLRKGRVSFLMMNHPPEILTFFLIVILVIIIIPVISFTGVINSEMDLPNWLSGIEGLMREKEDRASDIMGFLIESHRIPGMTLNLLILAVIPAFAEELLFRGVFQQLFINYFRSYQAGIWVTAILFSTVHFQFYGFLPRLILGLLFGYLFFWTGNLWSAIIPHFLNNAIPVVMTFLSDQNQGMVRRSGEERVFPFIPIILSALILWYLWYLSQKRRRD